MHVRGVARTDERVMREAIALKEAGFAVTILDIEDDMTRPVEEEIRGIHVKHFMKPGWLRRACFKPLRPILSVQKLICTTVKLIQTPADIYHAHDDNALAPCYITALWHKALLIFDAHELPLSDLTATRWNKLTRLFIYLLTAMISRCDGVITVSPPIREYIYKQYGGAKATLVRNVPLYRVVPKSDRLRHHLGLSPDTHIALYQGNVEANRGLHKLVYAASFLSQGIIIVIMGKGLEVITAHLQSLIASEGVADRVKLLPPVPYEQLLDWTASADIGLTLLPPDYSLSIRWCLPNKLFEYLMAGLPILSSQLDAVAEVIKTYEVGQIAPSLEPAAIAATITRMMADRSMLQQMRANALRAAQKFCWEEEKQQLICLYQSFLLRGGEE